MKTLQLVCTALVVLLQLAGIASDEATNSVSTASDVPKAVHDLRLSLVFPKTTFTNGEPIVARSVFTNTTESPVSLPTAHVGSTLVLAVTNENNLRIPLMDDSYGEVYSSSFALSVPPHDCISDSVEISRLFSLKPGVYRISAKREMALYPPFGQSFVASDVATITITGAAKE
jgi:hypothetical protein